MAGRAAVGSPPGQVRMWVRRAGAGVIRGWSMAMARPVFEREVTGERNRDKIAASKRRACG